MKKIAAVVLVVLLAGCSTTAYNLSGGLTQNEYLAVDAQKCNGLVTDSLCKQKRSDGSGLLWLHQLRDAEFDVSCAKSANPSLAQACEGRTDQECLDLVYEKLDQLPQCPDSWDGKPCQEEDNFSWLPFRYIINE